MGYVSMSEEERNAYRRKKGGVSFIVNVEVLYKTPSQRASVLGVKENELADIAPEFTFTVTKIRKFAEPELDAEFFQMAFPEGNVKDEKGLDKYIDSQIEEELGREADYVFTVELRNYLINKARLTLPEEFLKKWLFTINEGKFSMEDIERDFPQFLNMMRWNLIQKHFIGKLDV